MKMTSLWGVRKDRNHRAQMGRFRSGADGFCYFAVDCAMWTSILCGGGSIRSRDHPANHQFERSEREGRRWDASTVWDKRWGVSCGVNGAAYASLWMRVYGRKQRFRGPKPTKQKSSQTNGTREWGRKKRRKRKTRSFGDGEGKIREEQAKRQVSWKQHKKNKMKQAAWDPNYTTRSLLFSLFFPLSAWC